jgi:hypothetical protein
VGSARVWDERTRAARAGKSLAPEFAPDLDPTLPAALAPDELSALVAGIVAVTLDTRLPDCAPARRALLARELEVRLLSLFLEQPTAGEAPQALAPAGPEEQPTEEELEAAPDRMDEADAEHALSLSPAARALRLVLEDRLSQLGGPLGARADLRQRLITLALTALESPRDGQASGASSEELHSLDLLQRRAHKLERSLQDARAALAYVSGLEHIDQGLASIYRAVQGLTLSDPRHTQKRDVLEGIFRANLALQKPADDAAPSPG